MRTLITGGAGFIGSHLCNACVELGEVRVLDDLSSGDRSLLPDAGVEFIQASILDPDAVARAMVG
ncbi:MAG: NAD-dependent epimerase/dehydratase family protein, partial [Verrucomicrobiota bacterium]